MIPKFSPTPWLLRDEALPPCAVLALGALSHARLLACLDAPTQNPAHFEQLSFRYPGVDANLNAEPMPALLLWLSPAGLRSGTALPWFDGAAYVGAAVECPQLWLPCSLAPSLPPEWLHAAARRRTLAAKHLLWPDPALLVALP